MPRNRNAGSSGAPALRLEEREYTAMREDGLIGSEVYTTLMQDLTARRAAAEDRPRLDNRAATDRNCSGSFRCLRISTTPP